MGNITNTTIHLAWTLEQEINYLMLNHVPSRVQLSRKWDHASCIRTCKHTGDRLLDTKEHFPTQHRHISQFFLFCRGIWHISRGTNNLRLTFELKTSTWWRHMWKKVDDKKSFTGWPFSWRRYSSYKPTPVHLVESVKNYNLYMRVEVIVACNRELLCDVTLRKNYKSSYLRPPC